MAKSILLGLGEKVNDAKTIEELLVPFPNGMGILSLIEQRQEILKLAWLSQTGHQRPGIPQGLSIEEAEEKVKMINLRIQSLLKK